MKNWNEEVTLIDYPEIITEYGESLNGEPIELTVLAQIRSATRQEFYDYGSPDNRPEIVIVINRFEYSGQLHCFYNGTLYTVIREYPINSKLIELTLGRDIGTSR